MSFVEKKIQVEIIILCKLSQSQKEKYWNALVDGGTCYTGLRT